MTTNLTEDYIRSSFFLPQQVLSNKGYSVAPINIVTGAHFTELYPTLKKQTTVVLEGATLGMLTSSDYVGLSFRCILSTGEKLVVAKAWQGPVDKVIKRAVVKKKLLRGSSLNTVIGDTLS